MFTYTNPQQWKCKSYHCAFSLTTCWLVHPFQSLDADCLKTLKKLGDLRLAWGTFTNVPLTSQLTCLVLLQATIHTKPFGKQGFGLRELSLREMCEVKGLQDGICACTSLSSLKCIGSLVETSLDTCKLNNKGIPSAKLVGLTALTQLESLELRTSKAYPNLEPVYGLKTLKHLCIGCGSSICVTAGLSCLSNLRTLQLTATT